MKDDNLSSTHKETEAKEEILEELSLPIVEKIETSPKKQEITKVPDDIGTVPKSHEAKKRNFNCDICDTG